MHPSASWAFLLSSMKQGWDWQGPPWHCDEEEESPWGEMVEALASGDKG